MTVYSKEKCHEIVYPRFLQFLTHLGSSFINWSIFAYGFNFVEIFSYAKKLYDVIDTAESSLTVCVGGGVKISWRCPFNKFIEEDSVPMNPCAAIGRIMMR